MTPAWMIEPVPRAPRTDAGLHLRSLGEGVVLDLPAGSYVCLLGPVGAGKSTVLRLLCGGGGEVWLGGVALSGVPPHRRRIGLLARGGSLAGCRSVGAALGRAMAWRGLPPRLHGPRIAALTDEFELDARADPARLGPDAALRARLAAALAGEPALLLLDDPLERADDTDAMIDTLRRSQRRRGLMVLHATRRRAEAFALADHVVLMDAGRVLQAGAPAALYDRPASLFVACRLGPANVLAGRIEEIDNDVALVRLACGPVIEADPPADPVGPDCQVLLRPERISVSPIAAADLGGGAIPGLLRDVTQGAGGLRLLIALGADVELVVTRPAALGAAGLVAGRSVSVAWQSRHALVYPMS